MQIVRWVMFTGAIAYCGDVAAFGGVHGDAVIALAHNIGRGILLGLLVLV